MTFDPARPLRKTAIFTPPCRGEARRAKTGLLHAFASKLFLIRANAEADLAHQHILNYHLRYQSRRVEALEPSTHLRVHLELQMGSNLDH